MRGASGSTRRALPNSYSAKVTWRTSDTTGTGTLGELNTYVQAITQVGNTVFTGGDFAWVENAATGEKFLAGYDVTTGELVRIFMPTFNGQIKALEALPNGTLAVGGEFTEVNSEVNDTKTWKLAQFNTTDGNIAKAWTWEPSFSRTSTKTRTTRSSTVPATAATTSMKAPAPGCSPGPTRASSTCSPSACLPPLTLKPVASSASSPPTCAAPAFTGL